MAAFWLKQHWFVFLFACAVGVIFIFPHLYLRVIDRASFQGIDMLGSDAELHYVSRIQEVYDGHPGLGQTYLWEGKDASYLQPPLPEIVIASLGKIVGAGAVGANIGAKFLLGFLLAVLIYFFLFDLFDDAAFSLAGASFVLLGSMFTSLPDAISLFSRSSVNFEFLRYARPVNPAFSSILIFGYLFSFFRLLKTGYNRYRVFCVVTLGLSFYAYVYAWSYVLAANGVFFLWFAAKRRWAILRDIVLIFAGAFVVAIPYFLNTAAALRDPSYPEMFSRFGFFASHAPLFSKFALLAAVAWAISFIRKSSAAHPFLGLSFAAALLAANHQVVSGINIQNDHYHWYVVTPLASIMILAAIYFFVRDAFGIGVARRAAQALIAVFFIGAVVVQYRSYLFSRSEVLSEQRFVPVLRWLESNTPRDSAVVADAKFSELISAYTHDNAYYSVYAPYYLVSRERLEQNYFVYLYMTGARADTAAEFLQKHRNETAAYLFGLKYRYTAGCSSCFPDSENERVVEKYREFLKGDIIQSLKRYRADYLVWDGIFGVAAPFLKRNSEKLFESNGIVVYKIL